MTKTKNTSHTISKPGAKGAPRKRTRKSEAERKAMTTESAKPVSKNSASVMLSPTGPAPKKLPPLRDAVKALVRAQEEAAARGDRAKVAKLGSILAREELHKLEQELAAAPKAPKAPKAKAPKAPAAPSTSAVDADDVMLAVKELEQELAAAPKAPKAKAPKAPAAPSTSAVDAADVMLAVKEGVAPEGATLRALYLQWLASSAKEFSPAYVTGLRRPVGEFIDWALTQRSADGSKRLNTDFLASYRKYALKQGNALSTTRMALARVQTFLRAAVAPTHPELDLSVLRLQHTAEEKAAMAAKAEEV